MSLRKSAWLAVAVAAGLVLVFGGFLFWQTVGVSAAEDRVRTFYFPAVAQAGLLETALSDMERGVANHLLTGREAELGPYVNGVRRSDLALGQLQQLLRGEPELLELTTSIRSDRDSWIEEIATPTNDLVREGASAAALAVFDSPLADELLLQMQSDSSTLGALIEEEGVVIFDELTTQNYLLVLTVVVSVLLLWGFLMGAFFLARRRIIEPVDDLGRQVRLVARRGEHTRLIHPVGPSELRALGADVEELRRQLVSEIDEARSAREALDQKAPAVAAIRTELAAGQRVAVAGLQVYGTLQPAEGVLAGDWWDSTMLRTGEAAVIVADISGHGAEAGIAAMQLKHAIQHDLLAGDDIGEVAASAAEVFQSHNDRFATVATVCVQPETGAIRYINAGHPEPIIVDPAGACVASLTRTGPILSWLGGDWEIGTAVLPPGHTLILYSDGLVESHDFEGNELGQEQLLDWLATMPVDQRSPDALVPWLVRAARQRAVDWNRDDVTVVAVRRDAGEDQSPGDAGRFTP